LLSHMLAHGAVVLAECVERNLGPVRAGHGGGAIEAWCVHFGDYNERGERRLRKASKALPSRGTFVISGAALRVDTIKERAEVRLEMATRY
jgi:hypothetical protein